MGVRVGQEHSGGGDLDYQQGFERGGARAGQSGRGFAGFGGIWAGAPASPPRQIGRTISIFYISQAGISQPASVVRTQDDSAQSRRAWTLWSPARLIRKGSATSRLTTTGWKTACCVE